MLLARRVAFGLCAALAARPAAAQRPRFQADAWTEDDGLPSTAITSLVQTADGYLWVATGGQLVRFDGVSFDVFNAQTTPALRDRVDYLHVGLGDTLWIALADGSVLSMADGRFAVLGRMPGREHARLLQQVQHSVVVFWDSIMRWDGGAFRAVPMPPVWRGMRGLAASRDGAGTVWVIGRDRVVVRVTEEGIEAAGTTDTPHPVTDPSGGRVLLVHRSGALGRVVDPRGSVVMTYHWAPDVDPRLIDRHGRLWAQSANEILAYMAGRREPIAHISVSYDLLNPSVLEDHAGDIWFAGSALIRIREVPFQMITPSPQATSIARQFKQLRPGPQGTVIAQRSSWGAPQITVARCGCGPTRSRPADWWVTGRAGRISSCRVRPWHRSSWPTIPPVRAWCGSTVSGRCTR
jgi:ligand-binding sensor domain-containing protein